MKERMKIDRVESRLTKDYQGYDAYAYDLFLGEKLVDTIIYSDTTQRNASDKVAKFVRDKCEFVKVGEYV